MYYFAYGVHMNHRQLFALCPGARFVSEGELSGYMLIFDGYCPDTRGAIVNLERSFDDAICGGLFEIDDKNLKSLDENMGYPRYSERSLMQVRKLGKSETVQAWVYFHEPLVDGMPSHEYINAMVQGARDCRLPEGYIFSSIEPYRRVSDKNK
ncbi:MAG: gamma-glutamylcyclotransferase [Candidatus Omnitrophica bacterium]|nr:gamma-glutamylcyclotransferase [Candidatus Omnitrophota bacterium]